MAGAGRKCAFAKGIGDTIETISAKVTVSAVSFLFISTK
jgi:hypothetical protein